jgi:hypothetical protein
MYTQTDLIVLIEQDLGPGRKSGRWVLWRCPFHDDHTPSLAATNGDGTKGAHWQCFTCSDKHGGPVAWLMEYKHMTKEEALNTLNGSRSNPGWPGRDRAESPLKFPDIPPCEAWQQRARLLIERAKDNLWGERGRKPIFWQSNDPTTGEVITQQMTPLEWLIARGLREDTLRIFDIGYIPIAWQDEGKHWGQEHPVNIFPGILIPCVIDHKVWYLKYRRPEGKPKKYLQILGSQPALYLIQTLEVVETGAVIFCEGEFDALLLWQEIQFDNLAAVVTLGSVTNELNTATWGVSLLNFPHRFQAYDSDPAGEKGGSKLEWMHTRRLTIPQLRPHDKDLTDFYMSGGSLREWLKNALESPRTGDPALTGLLIPLKNA